MTEQQKPKMVEYECGCTHGYATAPGSCPMHGDRIEWYYLKYHHLPPRKSCQRCRVETVCVEQWPPPKPSQPAPINWQQRAEAAERRVAELEAAPAAGWPDDAAVADVIGEAEDAMLYGSFSQVPRVAFTMAGAAAVQRLLAPMRARLTRLEGLLADHHNWLKPEIWKDGVCLICPDEESHDAAK